MAGHRDDGTVAEDKAHHPNRRVDWDSLFNQTVISPLQAQQAANAWMNDPDNAPYLNRTPATFSPEVMAEFGLGDNDNANPHGMKRPDLTGIEVKDDD